MHILVAEDNVEVRIMYEILLQQEGTEILLTPSATQALELFKLHQKTILIVITDGKLGKGPDGLWLAQEIRKMSSIPIILISGSAQTFLKECDPRLFNTFLEKPFNASALQKVIRESVQRKASDI